jgi:predicted nuclease of predicted toxin-antitoxin system
VTRLRDVLPTDTPDPIVAKTSQDMGAILISDDADFKNLAGRKANAHKPRFRKLSRVNMKCKHAVAVNRIEAAITLIEFEYEIAQARADKRMIIDVQPTLIRTLR